MVNPKSSTEKILRKKSMRARGELGFSMVELLITISMFFIISGLALANFKTFNSHTVLDNLAHEIALTIRQAQVFGIGVREEGGQFPSYGTYFDLADNKNFTLFADIDPATPDGKFTGNDSLIKTYAIQRGNFISKICGYESSTQGAPCVDLEEAHITYLRPNLEGNLLGIFEGGEDEYSYMKIFLSTADDAFERVVTVWSNGQIAVE